MWGKGMGRTQRFILLHNFAMRRISTPYKYISGPYFPIFSGFSSYRHHSTPYEHFPSAIEMKLTFFFPSLHKTLPSWSISRSLKISPGFTPALGATVPPWEGISRQPRVGLTSPMA